MGDILKSHLLVGTKRPEDRMPLLWFMTEGANHVMSVVLQLRKLS